MKLTTPLLLLMATVFSTSCGQQNNTDRTGANSSSTDTSGKATAVAASNKADSRGIVVTSSAFAEGGTIPTKYTCDGEDISPPVSWSNIPPDAKSIALICDDPDAPKG